MKLRILSFVLIFLGFISCKPESNAKKTIVAIGDSNGAREKSWVYHLQQLKSSDTLLNYCVSGNTIGFDNLDRQELNTLRNINRYLSSADSVSEKIDQVLILLGTNDCKAVFTERLSEVPQNMQKLITAINNFHYKQENPPQIIIISPPPFAHDSILIEKYLGGNARVQNLVKEFSRIAKENNIRYIDIYNPLQPEFHNLNEDGVHLNQDGYKIMAELIFTELKK